MTKHGPIHLGEILERELLGPLGVDAAGLAPAIHVPPNRAKRLINGQAAVTPNTALRLAPALRTAPEFWINPRLRFDLDTVANAGGSFDHIAPIVAA